MKKISSLSEKTILARKVKAIEDALHVSAKELAKVCALSASTIYRIDGRIKKDTAITEKTLLKVCEKTGVDPAWLLDLNTEDDQPRFINGETTTVHGACETDREVYDHENELQTPADRGRALRAEMRMSQVEFGKYVGISSGSIAAIETGRSRLTDQVAAKIEEKCEHGGAEWLLIGNRRNKEYPINAEMIEWLKNNSKVRRDIWRMMQDEKEEARDAKKE